MPGKFCVSLTCAKDNSDKATVAFVIANASVASDKETVVFLSVEGVRLAETGYADDIAEEDGWALLATLGTNISKLRPAFDSRLYGHTKLSDLIRSQSKWFELETRGMSPTGGAVLYARTKNRTLDNQAR